jgi:DNA-directed RNA polymerase specialized sigma subunit
MNIAKQYLKQYENAVKVAQRVRREYEEELDLIDNIRSSLGGDGLPRSGEISRKVENQALKLSEKADALREAEAAAIEVRQEIFKTVMRVPDEKGSVLYERYVLLKDWRDVADSVGYSEAHTYELHRQGLDYVNNLLGNTTS